MSTRQNLFQVLNLIFFLYIVLIMQFKQKIKSHLKTNYRNCNTNSYGTLTSYLKTNFHKSSHVQYMLGKCFIKTTGQSKPPFYCRYISIYSSSIGCVSPTTTIECNGPPKSIRAISSNVHALRRCVLVPTLANPITN